MEIKSFEQLMSVRETEKYKDAEALWCHINDEHRFFLEPVVGKEIYQALCYSKRCLEPMLEVCEMAFDSKKDSDGFLYYVGCYFQNRRYCMICNIKADIDKCKALLSIYDKERFPNEVETLKKIIERLEWGYNKFKEFFGEEE